MSVKDLFEARTEYPLPKKAKTKDYIFYFVSAGDGYGKGARAFLGKFYGNHVEKSVSSVEELVDYLDGQVANGVEHIREIVMVSHGNARGLQLRILEDVSDATNKRDYSYLTFESLAKLRRAFVDDKFTAFKKKRDRVVAKIKDTSWVTIRACRFGAAVEAMYALYAFFGGRANVYAPRHYQFFAWQPIGWPEDKRSKRAATPEHDRPARRFETRLDAHAHLVKQRFFPRDLHTEERKEAVVQFLIDRGRYSETVEIDASSNPASDPDYESLIDTLDRARIPDKVRDKLAEHDHVLTSKASAKVVTDHRLWRIRDITEHQKFEVEYEIWEELSMSGTRASLKAAARIVDKNTSAQQMPFQSFFCESEHDIWRLKVETLVSYRDDPRNVPPFDAAVKAKLDATVAALDHGWDADLAALFQDRGVAITATPSVTRSGAAGKGPWIVTSPNESYVVKLEHPMLDDDVEGHALVAYRHLTKEALVAEQYELMKWLGSDPDTPGPELAAYLDRIATADLMAMIDYLRDPYREESSFYIHHAQQALGRKRDYHTWWSQQMAAADQNDPVPEFPYLDLTRGEASDKDTFAYSFDFNEFWAEVKASFPKMPAFTTDLFLEDDVWTRLRGAVDIIETPPTVEGESPAFDLEEARRIESQGAERYFKDDKVSFEETPSDTVVSCEEFAALMKRWKELESETLADIQKTLEAEIGPKGKTLFQTLKDWKELYDIYKGINTATTGAELGTTWFYTKILDKIPWLAPNAVGTPTGLGLLVRVWGVWSAVTVPIIMWKKFMDEQARTDAIWRRTGKIVGVRRYLRKLWDWTTSADYPNHLDIQLDANDVVDWYYREQLDIWGSFSPFVWAVGEMKKGFTEGVEAMQAVGPEVLKVAETAVADALYAMGLDACKTQVLVDAGYMKLDDIHAKLMRALISRMLDEVPNP